MTSGNPASTPSCGICAMIDRIKAGTFNDFIAELKSCYVILGDQQFYRGYCVLLAKIHATELYLMPDDDACLLFDEMRLTAEAIAEVVKPWKMNYECLGNSEPHVHWHLLPRDVNESAAMKRGPIWLRPESERKVMLDENDRSALIASLRKELAVRFSDARIPRD
jgi:diadenosine tetraphosphate (Ap4A) HIT family hydrolase